MEAKVETLEGNRGEISPTLRRMEIGDKVCFPMRKTYSVRSCCRQVDITTGMKFTTTIDSREKTVTVTRIK